MSKYSASIARLCNASYVEGELSSVTESVTVTDSGLWLVHIFLFGAKRPLSVSATAAGQDVDIPAYITNFEEHFICSSGSGSFTPVKGSVGRTRGGVATINDYPTQQAATQYVGRFYEADLRVADLGEASETSVIVDLHVSVEGESSYSGVPYMTSFDTSRRDIVLDASAWTGQRTLTLGGMVYNVVGVFFQELD